MPKAKSRVYCVALPIVAERAPVPIALNRDPVRDVDTEIRRAILPVFEDWNRYVRPRAIEPVRPRWRVARAVRIYAHHPDVASARLRRARIVGGIIATAPA